MSQLEDKFLRNGDVDIHYVEAGPSDGQLVLLLHGFPSFWYTWKHQIGPLADAGFHAVAPDLRGYNLSSKPLGVAAYGRQPLLSDVTALLDRCAGGNRAILVGHDWGGQIAWSYAREFPERLSRLVILNVPFPSSFAQALRTDPGQMKRSWYIFLFQMPSFGETWLSANNFGGLRRIVHEDPTKPQAEEHFQKHVEIFSMPGSLTAPINYYRALFKHWGASGRDKGGKIEMPVLVLWGEKDYVFEPYLVDPPGELVPHATVVRFPQASHWVMWDEPQAVTSHILQFIGQEKDKVTASELARLSRL